MFDDTYHDPFDPEDGGEDLPPEPDWAQLDRLLMQAHEYIREADCPGNIRVDITALALTDYLRVYLRQWRGADEAVSLEQLRAWFSELTGHIEHDLRAEGSPT